jgi:hypothetical protein
VAADLDLAPAVRDKLLDQATEVQRLHDILKQINEGATLRDAVDQILQHRDRALDDWVGRAIRTVQLDAAAKASGLTRDQVALRDGLERPDLGNLRQHLLRLAEDQTRYETMSRLAEQLTGDGSGWQSRLTEVKGERALTEHVLKHRPELELALVFDAGQGFDQVWIRRENGRVVEFLVGEAKGPTAKLRPRQMTAEWIIESIAKMPDIPLDHLPHGTANLKDALRQSVYQGHPPIRGLIVQGEPGASDTVQAPSGGGGPAGYFPVGRTQKDDGQITVNRGPRLHDDGSTETFAIGADREVRIPKGEGSQSIDDALAQLGKLHDLGLPTPYAGRVLVDGQIGMLSERFALRSDEVVRMESDGPRVVDPSITLSARTASDLKRIQRMLNDGKIRVSELSFLIAPDGRVALAPTSRVEVGPGPSRIQNDLIEALIRAAEGERP